MKKFTTLLKKELKELLTIQMFLPLIFGALIFAFIGNVIGNETEKANDPQKLYIVDYDQTQSSEMIINSLEQSNFIVTDLGAEDIDKAIEKTKNDDIKLLLSIDQGFEEGLNTFKQQEIKTYTFINNFSLSSSIGAASINSTISAINEYLSNTLISQYIDSDNIETMKEPVISIDNTIVKDNIAKISPGEVTSFILSQTTFLPIIMFIIIIFASQMTAVSIASEKENKTLETLLSTPVSRISLVSTKMIASAIVSFIMAGVYMVGFRIYMNGITGGMLDQSGSNQNALSQLGLSMDINGYILLGASLFLSILIALAISTIAGAFAEDVKKVQGLITPIIFLILIPYIISMFVDLESSSIIIKIIMYIIPFSHTFLATPNIFLKNYDIIAFGLAYQVVIFAILVTFAAKIFSSDKILTLKLSFGKKKKLRNN